MIRSLQVAGIRHLPIAPPGLSRGGYRRCAPFRLCLPVMLVTPPGRCNANSSYPRPPGVSKRRGTRSRDWSDFVREAFALNARARAARAAALRIVNGQGRLAAVAAA